jgi:hypothetical protein
MQHSEPRWCSARSDICVKHDSIQDTRGRGVGAVRGQERIIDDIEVGTVG